MSSSTVFAHWRHFVWRLSSMQLRRCLSFALVADCIMQTNESRFLHHLLALENHLSRRCTATVLVALCLFRIEASEDGRQWWRRESQIGNQERNEKQITSAFQLFSHSIDIRSRSFSCSASTKQTIWTIRFLVRSTTAMWCLFQPVWSSQTQISFTIVHFHSFASFSLFALARSHVRFDRNRFWWNYGDRTTACGRFLNRFEWSFYVCTRVNFLCAIFLLKLSCHRPNERQRLVSQSADERDRREKNHISFA